jgi:hypothetical protein
LELLLVQGSSVVRRDELVTVDEAELTGQVERAGAALLTRAGVTA